ncbi:MAG TPA: hypothetical protein VM261_35705 [Kofleriaceae bacterium]|nr:hypothetical protein [Kofleriaceae bacterium]
MKSMLFVLVFVMATVPGCGGSKTDSYNDLLVGMNKFKDAMCACSDAACAKKTHDELGRWAVAHQSTIESARPSDRQLAEMKPLENEYKACQAKVNGGE